MYSLRFISPQNNDDMDAALYKNTKVSRGFTYHYFYSPAAAGKPTLLLIHGFPSSSYDWHRQVEYFRPKGYGLLVPDVLGAGETSRPEETEPFRLNLLARDIIDLLDDEGLSQVIGIAHDWGSGILSRCANLYQERFLAFAWNAVGYTPPQKYKMELDAFIEYIKAATGSPRYGYWKFFTAEDGAALCEQNIDSFLNLAYSETPEVWAEWVTPVGKFRQWIEEKRVTGLPKWLTQEEYDTLRAILVKSGLKSFMNFYHMAANSLNHEDDAKIPEEAYVIRKPVLFVATSRDPTGPPAMWKPNHTKYAPQAKVIEVETGHWLMFEATDRVNAEWEAWIESLDL
ncbi:Alpha/Beta hydrolase protein [Lenzites betulinus]|nr:Alpha/Beta hydrolase protein [Lenzites betulinus]